MSRAPRCSSFDFYPQDFLQDQRVQVMTSEQRGAYISLICAAWTSETPGILPAQRDALARLAGCTPEEWNRCERAVGACFDTSDGRWVHRRVRRDYEAQDRRVRIRRSAGKLGNEVRWRQRDESHSDPMCDPLAIPSPLLPSTLPTPKKSQKTMAASAAAVRSEFVIWYAAYPRKVKPKAAALAYARARRDTDAATLLGGVKRYAAEVRGTGTDKIMHPTTWLNGGCWADEPSTNGHESPQAEFDRLYPKPETARAG